MQAISLYLFETSKLRRQKISLLYLKLNTQVFKLSLFFLKGTGSDLKMAKTKVVLKNANWRRSEAKD